MTVIAIVIVMIVASVFGIVTIRNMGTNNANQSLMLLCEVGEKNLDTYFESVEQSVEMVSAYVESDLEGIEELDDEQLQAHLDRVNGIFKQITYKTSGVLTYYYRIDPEASTVDKGFWYVNLNGDGFEEHEVTDITQYDTNDTSQLVWFTVPKASGGSIWLPPYITDNLGERVISYNVPVYFKGKFIGVIGIEIDYETMADYVNSITLYDNGYAFINDAEGNIIYHPRIDVTTLAEEDVPKVPEGLVSDGAFVRYNFGGVEKQAVWLPLENGMRLNVSVPVAEINAGWQEWAIEISVIFAMLLIIFIVLIMHSSKRITKPLRELTEAAKRVGKGDYEFSLDYRGDDEVGVLAKTFGQLTAHLKTYISDLNDLAYADALTQVRNKGAFDIYMKDLQARVDGGDESLEMAVCVFDCNGLKAVNDEFGHDKGDIYLKVSCAKICAVFSHSPVFRIGGDEFAAILMGNDYARRDELMRRFDEKCEESLRDCEERWNQVDIARGMADYDSATDKILNDTVRRADRLMYEDKREKKAARGSVSGR